MKGWFRRLFERHDYEYNDFIDSIVPDQSWPPLPGYRFTEDGTLDPNFHPNRTERHGYSADRKASDLRPSVAKVPTQLVKGAFDYRVHQTACQHDFLSYGINRLTGRKVFRCLCGLQGDSEADFDPARQG